MDQDPNFHFDGSVLGSEIFGFFPFFISVPVPVPEFLFLQLIYQNVLIIVVKKSRQSFRILYFLYIRQFDPDLDPQPRSHHADGWWSSGGLK